MSEAGAAPAAGQRPGRRGRTPSADVERELLAAAEAVLVQDGPGGLTVRAVAAEAGIAPMGVYNRLGGKDGVVNALLVRGFDRLRGCVEDTLRDAAGQPGMRGRLVACGLNYRKFALENAHFYAIMFEDAIPHERGNPVVEEHAHAAFGALVRMVELATAAGVIAAADPVEAAQQVWSAVHGAVALELKGLVLTPDPERTYRAFLETLIRGLAPAGDLTPGRRPARYGTVAGALPGRGRLPPWSGRARPRRCSPGPAARGQSCMAAGSTPR